jgi:hypothetical protein
MQVQLLPLYRVSKLKRYGVKVRGKVRSVYPPLDFTAAIQILDAESNNFGRKR